MAISFGKAPRQEDAARLHTIPTESPDAAFLDAMAREGLSPSGLIPGDEIQRFDVEKSSDKAGWYVFHASDSPPWGVFGNWQTGLQKSWCLKSESAMTDAERAAFKTQVKAAQTRRKKLQEKLHAAAKVKAENIWKNAQPAPLDHQYLVNKGIPSHGLRIGNDGRLIIPVEDIFGDIHSLQYIWPNGEKKFLTDGAIGGNFYTINGSDRVYVVEGLATGATVHAATGGTVIVAFNTTNLKPVAQNIRSKFPSSPIVFCADNDAWSKTNDGRMNPGVAYAREAAAEIGAKVVIPEFENPISKAETTDFNDLARVQGIDAVKLQIAGSPRRWTASDWNMNAYQGNAPERKWLVEHTFPMAAVSVLAAMGDAGKGMLTLKLALEVAADRTGIDLSGESLCFGNRVLEEGTAVIFTAEDDKDEIHRRLESIDPHGRRFGELARKRLIIIPLPNAGGPVSLISTGRYGPEATPIFYECRDMLLEIDDLKLVVFDPLASFVGADINADPAVGAYTTGKFASISTETGAATMLPHHMGKGNAIGVKSAEQARNLVRGTTAIVDGVRAVYVLWPKQSGKARQDCASLGVAFRPNRVFCGALVKSNGPGDRDDKTFVRNENGLLVVRDNDLERSTLTEDALLKVLYQDIRDAAFTKKQPFTKTKMNGLYERREELSAQLRNIGRDSLEKMAQKLIDSGDIIKCALTGSKIKQYLDVPGGPFASGIARFESGAGDGEECIQ
jgi:phage/plasmid primase-like uncharacterized protein